MISNSHKRRNKSEPSSSSSLRVFEEQDMSTRLAKMQDDREKDDDELDLEAALFGKKRKRVGRGSRGSGKGKNKVGVEGDMEDQGDMPGVFWEDKGDVGMSSGGNADEMFYEDAPLAEDRDDEEQEIDFEQDLEADSDDLASDQDDRDSSDFESDANVDVLDDVDAEPTSTPPLSWLSTPSSSKPSKKPLWQDPSDHQVSVDMSTDNRLRKLARSQPPGTSSTVDGRGLQSKLREQFEKMHPQPEWASEAKARAAKESNRKKKQGDKGSETVDPLQALFASTASFVDTSSSLTNRGLLPKGALEVRRLRDANYQNRTVWEGGNGKKKVQPQPGSAGKGKKETAAYLDTGMMDVKFHPKVEVLAAVGADRRLRLFNIDGHTNSSLLSLHIPSLPIKSMQFHPSGTSLLLTGSRPFYYTYDLRSQRCLRSPKNLLSNASASDPGSTYAMDKTVFSPDGSVLAVAGKRGIVTLLAWGPGGSGQVLTTLKSGRTGGVQDMMWRKGGKELWVLGEGSEVDVWDLGERRCVARWKDQGGFGGRLLKGSRNGDYCAVASTTGVVNVYDANQISSTVRTSIDVSEGLFAGASPRPIRELMNLTTEITNIAFNHDAQMMAISSSKKKDAFRMFHLPSATAFTNWPTSSTPLGVVTCSDFSAGSEYVAMGNTRGKILLYSVEHYKPLGA